jgi:PAS domain-containing protein
VVLAKLTASDRTRLVAALLAGLDGVPIDVQTATADRGSPRLLRWMADASLDGRSLDGMLLDISRDTRERDALLELAGLQRSFIDALPWPACTYDEAGDVLLGNRLWRRCADCTLELGGEEVPLPQVPEWLCRHRGDFAGGSAGERHLAVVLRSSDGRQQPAWLHRSGLRQGGTPLNVLSVESRPLPGREHADQDEAASRGR